MEFKNIIGQTYRKEFQDLCLNESSENVREWYNNFLFTISEIVEKNAAEVDRTGKYPHKSINALKTIGAFGIFAPKEDGGLGYNEPMAALAVETLASSCLSTAAILMFHFQVLRRLLIHGNKKQKSKNVPLLASGKILGASAWSELKAGADKTGIATKLSVHGNGFILNGEKNFCTGLEGVDIIHALVGYPQEDGSYAPTFVQLSASDPRITLQPMRDLMGLRGSSTGTIIINDYRCDENDIVGSPGNGMEMMRSNHKFLMNPGLLSLGIARRVYEEAKSAANGNWKDMRNTTCYQNTRFRIAEIEVELAASYAMATSALKLGLLGTENMNIEYCKVKMQASEMAARVSAVGMQLIGARSFSSSWPMERFFRESRATLLMGPTNEIIREWISSQIFKDLENTKNYASKSY